MNRLIVVSLFILLPAFTQSVYAQQPEASSVRLTVPKAPWAVTLSGEALALSRQEMAPDGSGGYFMLTDEKAQMIASVYIEPVDKCKTSKECRDFVWKRGNPTWKNAQNVKLGEMGEISTLELLVPEYDGKPVRQQNLYAEFVRDGYWVDVHLSKMLYQEQDRALFERMVKSVRFEPTKGEGAAGQSSAPPPATALSSGF